MEGTFDFVVREIPPTETLFMVPAVGGGENALLLEGDFSGDLLLEGDFSGSLLLEP